MAHFLRSSTYLGSPPQSSPQRQRSHVFSQRVPRRFARPHLLPFHWFLDLARCRRERDIHCAAYRHQRFRFAFLSNIWTDSVLLWMLSHMSQGFTTSAGANLLNIPPAAASILLLYICHILLSNFRVNAFLLIVFSASLPDQSIYTLSTDAD